MSEFTTEQIKTASIIVNTLASLRMGTPIPDTDLEEALKVLPHVRIMFAGLKQPEYQVFVKQLWRDVETLERFKEARKHP